MPNTLTFTVDILTKNAKDIDKLIDRVEELGGTAGTTAPKTEKLGGGISATTLAAGAAGLALGVLTSQVGGYVKSAIDAAARTEGLRNGLRTVIPDADEFEATLARIDKQARLPGLQKNDLLRFTTSMTAAGLTTDEVDTALTVLGSRIVGFGSTSAEAAQVVGQFTQAMNRGKIEGDELNRLFESLPGFKNIVTEMTGVTGGAQDLNDAFAAQGLTVQEGLIPLLAAYDESLGAINHDAALTKADAYAGALEDLRNTIGQKLLPIYKDFLDRGAEIADALGALVTGAKKLPQPFIDIKEAGEGILESLTPLLDALKDMGEAVLPLLKTIWKELVGVFIEVVIPTYAKVVSALSPVITKLVELGTPILRLINIILPPLVTLLKGVAGVVIDVVLAPLKLLAGAFGFIIEKITDLINLIPGAKVDIENHAEAHKKVTDEANKEATAIEGVTTATKTNTEEAKANKTAADEQAAALQSVKDKQVDLKVAVVAANLELKNAKTALKEATNPEEIEAASTRIETAITNVKDAKIAEAITFDDEGKKQIAVLKAEAAAAAATDTAMKTASKNREQYAKDLTTAEETAAEDRELALANEVAAASAAITSHTTNTTTSFTTRGDAFRDYKNRRKTLSDEVIANITASTATEAEKADAIRTEHENLATDLAEEWGKITTAEKTELDAQKQQATTESAAKAKAIKEANEDILDATKAHLVDTQTAYKTSDGLSQADRDIAFGNMLTALNAHHVAEIAAAEANGENTKTLVATQQAAIAVLIDNHNEDKLKKQTAAAKAQEKEQERIDSDAKKALDAENKIKLTATETYLGLAKTAYTESFDDLSINQDTAFTAYQAATSDHYDELIRQATQNGTDTKLLEEQKNTALDTIRIEHDEKVVTAQEQLWTDLKGIVNTGLGNLIKDIRDKEVSFSQSLKNFGTNMGQSIADGLIERVTDDLTKRLLDSIEGIVEASGAKEFLTGLFKKGGAGAGEAAGSAIGTGADVAADVAGDAGGAIAKGVGKAGGIAAGLATAGTAGAVATVGLAIAIPAAVFAATYLLGKHFSNAIGDQEALVNHGIIRDSRGRVIIQSDRIKDIVNDSELSDAQKTTAIDTLTSAHSTDKPQRQRGESTAAYNARVQAWENALKLFHFPEADEMARQAGRSASSGRGAFGDIKRKNAEDFSKYFGEGFAESAGGGNPATMVYDRLTETLERLNTILTDGNTQNALFRSPETNMIARDIVRSEALRSDPQAPYFADPNQIRNTEELGIGNRGNGFGGQQNAIKLDLTLMIDSDQIVTPRFAAKVDDQLSINNQSGNARR